MGFSDIFSVAKGIAGIFNPASYIPEAIDLGSRLFNLGSEVEAKVYNRNLQKQLFARDDNAIQRMAADYEAAGFNPLLAAGGTGASNTKGFEDSGLTTELGVSELRNQAMQRQLSYDSNDRENALAKQQIKDLIHGRKYRDSLDNAKVANNKFWRDVFNLPKGQYPDGIDISTMTPEQVATLLAAATKVNITENDGSEYTKAKNDYKSKNPQDYNKKRNKIIKQIETYTASSPDLGQAGFEHSREEWNKRNADKGMEWIKTTSGTDGTPTYWIIFFDTRSKDFIYQPFKIEAMYENF